MAGRPELTVASASQFRAALILDDMLGVLREHADLRDQCVSELALTWMTRHSAWWQ